MRHVHIDQLQLRVRGLSPEAARKAAAGLSKELQRRLREGSCGEKGGRITKLDAGSIRVDPRGEADAVTRAAARAVVRVIERKTP